MAQVCATGTGKCSTIRDVQIHAIKFMLTFLTLEPFSKLLHSGKKKLNEPREYLSNVMGWVQYSKSLLNEECFPIYAISKCISHIHSKSTWCCNPVRGYSPYPFNFFRQSVALSVSWGPFGSQCSYGLPIHKCVTYLAPDVSLLKTISKDAISLQSNLKQLWKRVSPIAVSYRIYHMHWPCIEAL